MSFVLLFLTGVTFIVVFGWLAWKVRKLDLDDRHTNSKIKYRANRYLIFNVDPDSKSYFGSELIWAYRAFYWLAIIGLYLILYSCSGN